MVHFLLHHTAYYTKKIIFAQLCTSSALVERVTQGRGWGRPLGAVHMAAAMLAWL